MCVWPSAWSERNANSALFLCLRYSHHLLPQESLWPLDQFHSGRLGLIKTRVATRPPSGPPGGALFLGLESARLRGCTHPQSTLLSQTMHPGVLEFPPRVLSASSPGLSSQEQMASARYTHPAAPGEAKRVGQRLDIQVGPLQTPVHRAPHTYLNGARGERKKRWAMDWVTFQPEHGKVQEL